MPNIVIFDFDGVIVDSKNAIISVYQSADPSFTLEDAHRRFIDNANKPPAPLSRDEFFNQYKDIAPGLPAIRGLRSVLARLAASYTLTINSSGHTDLINQFLANNNLDQYFSEVAGFDETADKTLKIQRTLEKFRSQPRQTVMITDTLGDLRDAHQAGIKTIAVSWGLHGEETLQQGNPTIIANNPEELPEKVENIIGA